MARRARRRAGWAKPRAPASAWRKDATVSEANLRRASGSSDATMNTENPSSTASRVSSSTEMLAGTFTSRRTSDG